MVIEQQQPDGSFRPPRYLSRTTLNIKRKWSSSELECAAIVQAIRRNPIFLRNPLRSRDRSPAASKSRKFVGQEQSRTEMVWFPERVHFYAEAQIEERERERRRPVATPSPSYHRRPSAQISPDRPFGPRCLLRRCQRSSPVITSNIVGLKFRWTGHRLWWAGKRFGWTGDNPRRCFSRGGGGGSARAQKCGKQVSRAASKRFLTTEDEARHEQWKAIQAVHPRSTWASQDEERSTEFLVDDYSPLVQPTIHAVVEGYQKKRY